MLVGRESSKRRLGRYRVRRRRFFLSLLATVFLALLASGPASAHGTWQLYVGYPQIWNGPIWGGVDAQAGFDIDPNHYRIQGKLELQSSNGGSWRVEDTDVGDKIQTGYLNLAVGTTCLMPMRSAIFTYYRTRLVYLRVITQTGRVHTEYRNVYRPAGFSLKYASFCAPI
jgi:hypothetical protein